MKKLLRKLRPNAIEQQTAQSARDQTYTTKDKVRVPSALQDLAKDRERFGLRLIPPHPLVTGNAKEDVELDIVAVHGLGGDFCRTWTKKADAHLEHDVFWLSQLLPVDLPGARVYSFGYDSQPAFSKSVATIRAFSQQLLQHLLAHSQAGKRRPTIFICHSLGGLVVKQAMVIANEDERFAEILRTTKAIMFMGTPHRGSDVATSLGPLIEVINFGLKYSGGSFIAGNMRHDLVQMLSRNSKALDHLNESFMPRAKNMLIISCYETRYPENLNQLVVSEQSAMLRIPDENPIPLSANHMTMCHFSSLSDSNYQLVSNALVNVARVISRTQGDLKSTSAQSLQSLTDSERRYTSYFRRDFQPTLQNERTEGTCGWLLDTFQYQQWQEDENSAVLWITGDAGCGKTTLASFMTEILRTGAAKGDLTGSRPVVMVFFCAKDVSARNDGQSIVCGLLISILTARRNVIRRVKAEYAPVKQEFGQSLEFLWNVLMYALDIASCDRYYLIIDALDECQAQSRERLFACIRRMLNSHEGKGWLRHKKIKLLFTSQSQTLTEWRALENTSSLYHVKVEDRPYGMTQDILKFINHEVDKLVHLRRCDLSFADELKKVLSQKAQNSFLWVSLVLSYIKATILLQAHDPQQLLAQLPDSLKEAYLKYLPSSTPQNAEIIRRCVQLLVATYRSLTLEETGAFTNITSQGYQPATQEQLTVFQNSLELMFGPLIRFPDLRVDFVHSTVKDLFLELGQDETHAMAKIYGTDIASAHLALADACVSYLLIEEMEFDFFNNIEPSSAISPVDTVPDDGDSLVDIFDIQNVAFFRDEEDIDDGVCSHIKNLFPPVDYAATNWAHHFASCEHIAPDVLRRKVRLLSNPGNVQVSNWYKYMAHHSRTIVPSFSRLDEVLVAAMFDHPEALRSLLSCHNDRPDVLETRSKVGLFWAASRGNARVVQVFLEHKTNPNFLENGQSPLIVAVLGGYQDAVKKLLQTPLTDPNLSDKNSRSPLVHAVASDQHEIICMLLTHKDILVNLPDRSGFTPLLEAASSGCLLCLRCLEADGRSDFTIHDKKGRNVLSYAACTESLGSVDLIVKNLTSEEVQSPDSSGRNAISYAAERSLLPIVRRLWRLQISVSQRDENGRNAISWAVSRPFTVARKDEGNAVLHFLIKKSPQSADVKDNSGWTPLAWALDRPGDLSSVRVLVEVGGVDVNQQDQSGRPALSWAASEGLEEITRYLLQVPGIKKNLRSFTGSTPISYATGSGSINTLRLLLNSEGVDPSISDDRGRSPLDRARLNHHEEAVLELSFLDSA